MALDGQDIKRQGSTTNKPHAVSFARIHVNDSQGIIARRPRTSYAAAFTVDKHHFLGSFILHGDSQQRLLNELIGIWEDILDEKEAFVIVVVGFFIRVVDLQGVSTTNEQKKKGASF